MKKLYILLLFMVCAGYAQQQPFVTTWEVQEWDTVVTIQTPDDSNYTIDFGDGIILNNQSGSVSHQYTAEGIYTISLSGNVKRFYFNEQSMMASKLRTIEQWGDIIWTSMESAFNGCNLEINATDIPDLSQLTNMSYMFSGNLSGYDFSLWDVSNVTNMEGMFSGSSNFTGLNSWNVSNVTNMEKMFSGCNTFNEPLSNWDVSNVTNMKQMFMYCNEFNMPLNNWNTINVIDMSGMFYFTQFNQPINNWNTINVIDMSGMFYITQFNQPINNWNVSNVTNMEMMFMSSHFNQNINDWDVSNVTSMAAMFKDNFLFNQPLNSWNTSNVADMRSMFSDANLFNQPLNDWDVSNVYIMDQMFISADVFNQPLNNWDVSSVTDMRDMFAGAISFNQPLNNWDVSNVIDMTGAFGGATSFNQPLDNWDISNVNNYMGLFHMAESFNQDLSMWNFNNLNDIGNFISATDLDENNYDALLFKFLQIGVEDQYLSGEGLKYCNTEVHDYLTSNLGWTIYDDGIGENCQNNNVTGTMLIDENLNGCEVTDAPAVNFMVQATNGTYNYGTFVNSNGNYDLRVEEDTYTVAPVNVPDYFTVTPPTAKVSFTGFGNSEALNFCLVPNQSVQDLNVTVLPIGDARPGFESEYKILVENIGTQSVANATVTLTFDNTLQSFVSATPAPATTSANQLTFNIGNLGVFETKEVNLTMTTFQPPVVNGGEVAVFTANVTPDAGDNTPDDNTFTLNQTIVNSYDPNDKRVVQGDEIYMEQTGEYLDYIIRFQNTGTASALTVRVEDTLSDNLDWATLKPIAASHAYRVEVTEGNKVNFIFDNINLPHEAADAPGSNGYIAYKVKPKQGIQLGDVIAGNAGIYFDFNLPIITNTVTTTVVEPLGVKQNTKTAVSVYPNPAGDVVHLQTHPGTQVQQVSVYNLQGSELMSVSRNQNPQTLNISSLSSGVYLLQVQTNTGRATCRLVKK